MLTLKDTSSLLQAVLAVHALSSSLHMYVPGSLRFVDTSSLVSKPEPHVEIVTSVVSEGVKLYTTSGEASCIAVRTPPGHAPHGDITITSLSSSLSKA